MENKERLKDKVSGALARGYCSKENSGKQVDATLINAMAEQILALVKERDERIKKQVEWLMGLIIVERPSSETIQSKIDKIFEDKGD